MRGNREKWISWELMPVIFSLAWPTMLEQLVQSAVQYVDTAMVGTLGTDAMAAVGATSAINPLMNGSMLALGVGFLAFIARALGAQDPDRARRIAAQSVPVVLVVGLVFTMLTVSLSGVIPVWMRTAPSIREQASLYFSILYIPTLFRTAMVVFGTVLRAAGDTKTPMRVGLGINLVNVVLNFLLIYPARTVTLLGRAVFIPGFGFGVAGAAAASAVAFALGGICMTIALWRNPILSPKGLSLRPDPEILKPCLRVALPNMLQRFATSSGYVVFGSMINALGEVSTAAHTIANIVESAFYIPGFGMQTAASTLAGNTLGKQDQNQMRRLTRTLLVAEVGLMILSGALLYLNAPLMMRIFSSNPEVIALGSVVLRMVALSEPFFGISIIVEGIFMGVGRTVRPFLYNVSGMWGIRIVGTFLCTCILGLGLKSAWGCMILHNVTLSVLYFTYCMWGRKSPLNFLSWNDDQK